MTINSRALRFGSIVVAAFVVFIAVTLINHGSSGKGVGNPTGTGEMTTANGSTMSMAPGMEMTGDEGIPTNETADFRTYVSSQFDNTGQLSTKVTKVYSQTGVQYAQTSLSKAQSTTAALAGQVCAALSNYELTRTGKFTGVTVLAQDGSRLIVRATEAQNCSLT